MQGSRLASVVEDFLTHHAEFSRLLVAVSGGPDSLALLHALLAARARFPDLALEVAHLNHSMRAGAADDAQFVAGYCRQHGLACHQAVFDVPAFARQAGLSPEDAARRARYAFLRCISQQRTLPLILTGHTADDQAETVLLRLLRGTGPDGLAGIDAFGPLPTPDDRLLAAFPASVAGDGIFVGRPLLAVWRSEVEAYVLEHALQPCQDPTNDQTIYRRNRLRHELLPQLEAEYSPALRRHLVNLARLSEADNRWLAALTEAEYIKNSRVRPDRISFERAYFQECPLALQRRLLRRTAADLAGLEGLEMAHIEAIIAMLEAAAPARLDLPGLLEAFCTRQFIGLARRGSDRLPPFEPLLLTVPGRCEAPDGRWSIEADLYDVQAGPAGFKDNFRVWLDYDKIGPRLLVRPRYLGEKFRPLGSPGRRKLQDVLLDAHVPAGMRPGWPLVARPDGPVVWVPGVAVAHDFRLTPATRTIVEMRFSPAFDAPWAPKSRG